MVDHLTRGPIHQFEVPTVAAKPQGPAAGGKLGAVDNLDRKLSVPRGSVIGIGNHPAALGRLGVDVTEKQPPQIALKVHANFMLMIEGFGQGNRNPAEFGKSRLQGL